MILLQSKFQLDSFPQYSESALCIIHSVPEGLCPSVLHVSHSTLWTCWRHCYSFVLDSFIMSVSFSLITESTSSFMYSDFWPTLSRESGKGLARVLSGNKKCKTRAKWSTCNIYHESDQQ